MLQVPTLPNYQLPQPNYNAVKIDIHNPTVGNTTCPVQQPQYNSQYAPVTAPYYTYPQTQLYDYPQVNNAQPYYQPAVQPANVNASANATANATAAVQQPVVQQPVAQQPAAQPVACQPCPPCPAVPAPQVAQAAAAAAATVQPAPQQVNINQAPQPAPVATAPQMNPAAPAEAPKVEVVPPVEAAPQVDLNGFIAKLNDPDFEVQANTMEEIANMVNDETQKAKATELLDSKIIDALTNIINTDSSKLAGPTQEQITARQKLMSGQQISDQEKALATTITPMEQAERNKSYAMFTSAILEKLYGDEVKKLTGTTVPLTELPAAMTIVDQLKDNPNPMVRTSAIEALSYIQNPEYKKDLTTLFTIAKNDQDKGVQEAATAALDKLNQI